MNWSMHWAAHCWPGKTETPPHLPKIQLPIPLIQREAQHRAHGESEATYDCKISDFGSPWVGRHRAVLPAKETGGLLHLALDSSQ